MVFFSPILFFFVPCFRSMCLLLFSFFFLLFLFLFFVFFFFSPPCLICFISFFVFFSVVFIQCFVLFLFFSAWLSVSSSTIAVGEFSPRRRSGQAMPCSQVSTGLPPGTRLLFSSRLGHSIPTSRRFHHSNVYDLPQLR